jgi:hypothetical protein
MLLLVGELHVGVWDPRGFMFRVLLSPYGPLANVPTAFEALVPRVPLLKLLVFLRLNLGCLGSESVLELFKLLCRQCQIVRQNLGQGFISINCSFHPPFPGGQIIAEHAHGVVVNLFHGSIIPRVFYAVISAGELESLV